MKKSWLAISIFLFAFPASSNYELKSYSFGAGGGESSSSNYSALQILGEQAGDRMTGSTYLGLPGLQFVQMANTPGAPTFTNDDNYYNKLNLIIDTQSNPSDTEYAIAISDDDFSTTSYVQSDNTVGSTLGSEDWQTYTDWGGASGEFVVGLDANTTYKVKVKARQGEYTEGPWGPTASAATSAITLSYDIDVSSIDEETAAPYELDIGTLSAGSVTTGSDKIWIDLTTNAAGGGSVYVYGNTGGLYSQTANYTISGVSANLSAVSEGFGLQSASVSESSGGPFAAVSPYNGSSENVGIVSTNPQTVFDSSSAPITSGRSSMTVKAKIKDLTPASTDYTETLTFIAAGNF